MAEANLTRCDLAIEAHEMLAMGKTADFSVSGVTVEEKRHNDYIKITRIKVDDENGERELGKPRGSYITIEMPSRFYGQQEIYEEMCKACAKELKSITDKTLETQDDTVLVVGLGNDKITADALGPKVVDSLMITRHLKKYIPEEIVEGIRPLCAIAPGVLGTNGMETEEVVRSLTNEIKPKLVIAIDALCSGNVERINTTVQITDTGITPGGGVGNARKTLNEDTLGIPVIAVGVPTVVDAATIAAAGIDMVISASNQDINIPCEGSERRGWIRSEIGEELRNMIVAPKDVDSVIEDIASVIANGINISMHDGITLADVDKYR